MFRLGCYCIKRDDSCMIWSWFVCMMLCLSSDGWTQYLSGSTIPRAHSLFPLIPIFPVFSVVFIRIFSMMTSLGDFDSTWQFCNYILSTYMFQLTFQLPTCPWASDTWPHRCLVPNCPGWTSRWETPWTFRWMWYPNYWLPASSDACNHRQISATNPVGAGFFRRKLSWP